MGFVQVAMQTTHAQDPEGATDADNGQQDSNQTRRPQQKIPHLNLLDQQTAFLGLTVQFLAKRLVHVLHRGNTIFFCPAQSRKVEGIHVLERGPVVALGRIQLGFIIGIVQTSTRKCRLRYLDKFRVVKFCLSDFIHMSISGRKRHQFDRILRRRQFRRRGTPILQAIDNAAIIFAFFRDTDAQLLVLLNQSAKLVFVNLSRVQRLEFSCQFQIVVQSREYGKVINQRHLLKKKAIFRQSSNGIHMIGIAVVVTHLQHVVGKHLPRNGVQTVRGLPLSVQSDYQAFAEVNRLSPLPLKLGLALPF
ncbi:hypothetical protein [Asticcacaulis sp. AC460]|uniref:hypothetical protein n=1 Tax=Asticcacaulis sp. AC460 TaxID=1282360 RepID=UPI001F20E1D3|nr:hypothetical protein [Asticcacaulis sp. AC460]